jgi:hypothetical protein
VLVTSAFRVRAPAPFGSEDSWFSRYHSRNMTMPPSASSEEHYDLIIADGTVVAARQISPNPVPRPAATAHFIRRKSYIRDHGRVPGPRWTSVRQYFWVMMAPKPAVVCRRRIKGVNFARLEAQHVCGSAIFRPRGQG